MTTCWPRRRQAAEELGGYGLNLHTLVTAPAKARNAYARLSELAARRAAVLDGPAQGQHPRPPHPGARRGQTVRHLRRTR